jgi:NADPH:quinone reductase-like Zn-dependent oxidoreductase
MVGYVGENAVAQRNTRIVVARRGGPEVLQYVEDELPVAGAGQVRVKVLAAGVAYADILMRRGMYPSGPKPPFTPGYDIVGDVDAVGQIVTNVQVGQRVAALTMVGGYSRYTTVRAEHLVPVPDGLDPAEAVSLVLNYVTAYQMLHRISQLLSGQRLLVHSAAGGVGTAVLQLGRLAGLVMFGTASKPKHALLSELGAIPIDYRSDDFVQRVRQFAPQGVDCVLDSVGGSNWWKSYKCLRRGGGLICYGVQAAVAQGNLEAGLGFAALGLMKLLPDRRKATWYNVKRLRDERPEWFRDDLGKLFQLLAARQIQPVIATCLPLREARRANEMLENSKVSGKIVLLPCA